MEDTKNETVDSLSPTPVKSTSKNKEGEVLMNFSQAMEVVLLGKKIRKLEWKEKEDSKDDYGFMENDFLRIHRKGKSHHWIINRGDIGGTDFVIV